MVHKIPASITIMYTIGVHEFAWLFDVSFLLLIQYLLLEIEITKQNYPQEL